MKYIAKYGIENTSFDGIFAISALAIGGKL
jgi:hypothetical protein